MSHTISYRHRLNITRFTLFDLFIKEFKGKDIQPNPTDSCFRRTLNPPYLIRRW